MHWWLVLTGDGLDSHYGERNVFGISPKPPLCVFLGFVFVFSPPDDEKISRESRDLELGSEQKGQ